jgi:pimeloyl-ACP methyl ester carboxylesterase
MFALNFESTGSGRPVVALHGYGASLFSWRHLPPALPDRKVIRIDLPGHGGSPARMDGRYTLSDHARLIIDFIEEQGLGEFDLIGHSIGGGVALMIAIELSERRGNSIKSLTLVDSIALPQSLPWFLSRNCVEYIHRGLETDLDRRLWPYSPGRETECRDLGDRRLPVGRALAVDRSLPAGLRMEADDEFYQLHQMRRHQRRENRDDPADARQGREAEIVLHLFEAKRRRLHGGALRGRGFWPL